MIDIHTHILHGVDHGSDSVEVSLRMLAEMEATGLIDTVVLTSHFYMDEESVSEYLERYNVAFDELSNAYTGPIKLVRGAEVKVSPYVELTRDVKKLTLGDTNYILLELPFDKRINEEWLFDTLSVLMDEYDLIPILAHIEEYNYTQKPCRLLDDLVDRGVYMHLDAIALLERRTQKMALNFIKRGYVDTIATDYHDGRRLCINEALEVVQKHLGKATREDIENFFRLT